jgi:hypothetical protein
MEVYIGILVLVSSFWVLIDSKNLGIKKYRIQGLGNMGPWGWFFSCLFIWPIGFPFYLWKRPQFKRIARNGEDSVDVQRTKPFEGRMDYMAFMIGVFVLGGLVAFPGAYGAWLGLNYAQALPWSLASALFYLLVFNRDGTISGLRFIIGLGFLYIIMQQHVTTSGQPAFVAGGFLGTGLMFVCGYIGVGIGRRLFPQHASHLVTEPLLRAETTRSVRQVKECPHCGEQLDLAAPKCQYCAEDIQPEMMKCPQCDEEIRVGARKCRHCGVWLDGSIQEGSPQPSGLSLRNGSSSTGEIVEDEVKPPKPAPLSLEGVAYLLDDLQAGSLSTQGIIVKYGLSPVELGSYCTKLFEKNLIPESSWLRVMNGSVECPNCLESNKFSAPTCSKCGEHINKSSARAVAANNGYSGAPWEEFTTINKLHSWVSTGFLASALVGFVSYFWLTTVIGVGVLILCEIGVIYLTYTVGRFVRLKTQTIVVWCFLATLPLLWLVTFAMLRNELTDMKMALLTRPLEVSD